MTCHVTMAWREVTRCYEAFHHFLPIMMQLLYQLMSFISFQPKTNGLNFDSTRSTNGDGCLAQDWCGRTLER